MSPVIQNKALQALGLDYVYVPFQVKKDDLTTVFAGFQSINLVGFNVTIPQNPKTPKPQNPMIFTKY